MDLQQFVAATLSQIIRGVEDAQRALPGGGNYVNPKLQSSPSVMHSHGKAIAQNGAVVHYVEFDVAVTVSSASTSSCAPTIGVVSAGSQEDSSARTGLNRIKFSVPISLP